MITRGNSAANFRRPVDCVASMRPRVITRGNYLVFRWEPGSCLASMRPRVITRGNNITVDVLTPDEAGFNEAAGDHPRKWGRKNQAQLSIRRFNEAAGDHPRKYGDILRWPAGNAGFNEAAGDHPRKSGPSTPGQTPPTCFNEAAGDHPRKCIVSEHRQHLSPASMRPRVITRGNENQRREATQGTLRFNEAAGDHPRKSPRRIVDRLAYRQASMRPRVITRGNPRLWWEGKLNRRLQ